MTKPVTVVVGVGPGLGAAVARRFAAGGHQVALVARRIEKLQEIEKTITDAGGAARSFAADVTDAASMTAVFTQIRDAMGHPEVLVYNASGFHMAGILELGVEAFDRAWATSCRGGFLAAREVAAAMVDAGQGTILFTGATAGTRGSARFAAFAVGKFGLRALAQSLARELGPKGVHVAHVIVDGGIATPRNIASLGERPVHSLLAPDAIAESYWHLHAQDRTAWTQELDLRPFVEKF